MSNKKPTSVNLREDLAGEMKERDESLSPLVNKWIHRYLTDSPAVQKNDKVMEELKNLRDEREALDAQFRSAMEAFDSLIAALEESGEDEPEEIGVDEEDLQNVHENLTALKNDSLNSVETVISRRHSPRDPTHAAVKTHAGKLGISPERLVNELERMDREGAFRVEGSSRESNAVSSSSH